MIINGKTQIVINGKTTRVLGHEFNRALRKGGFDIRDVGGKLLIPSKNLDWGQVAAAVRSGKSVQAKAA
jgi:hypothetical protein